MSTNDYNVSRFIDLGARGYYQAPVKIGRGADGKKKIVDFMGHRWSRTSTTDVAAHTLDFRGNSSAIDCGKSGIVVIDCDRKGDVNGEQSWAVALSQTDGGRGNQWRSTMAVDTPSGGRHYYYRAPDGETVIGNRQYPTLAVDVRGAGGCVFAPGSMIVSPTGHIDRYETYNLMDVENLSELPLAALEWLDARSRKDVVTKSYATGGRVAAPELVNLLNLWMKDEPDHGELHEIRESLREITGSYAPVDAAMIERYLL